MEITRTICELRVLSHVFFEKCCNTNKASNMQLFFCLVTLIPSFYFERLSHRQSFIRFILNEDLYDLSHLE